MIAGFDRYFQIAPCFRDEDARADRSPGEFYQLDIEMSFVEQEDVFQAVEPVLRDLFMEFAEGKPVTAGFPRITYKDSMAKYGTDKPDLRNPIEMADVTEHFRRLRLQGLRRHDRRGSEGARVGDPGAGRRPRTFCDRMNSWAQSEGQKGLGYIFWRSRRAAARRRRPAPSPRTSARSGPKRCASSSASTRATRSSSWPGGRTSSPRFAGRGAHQARPRPAGAVGGKFMNEDQFAFCWIVDFPMFECGRGRQARSTSRTTRSRCRRAGWRRSRPRTR